MTVSLRGSFDFKISVTPLEDIIIPTEFCRAHALTVKREIISSQYYIYIIYSKSDFLVTIKQDAVQIIYH